MNDQRVGAAVRAVRIRRGLRQRDVAQRARVSEGVVSLIERGHIEHVSLPALRRVAAALEIHVALSVTLPHGDLERMLNAGHAALHEEMSRYLNGIPGWVHAPEVSFAIYAERGVIDILAFHVGSGALLIIELKTEFVSLENLLTTMDIRMRHAIAIARERGWQPRSVSAWVVFADTATNRRRVAAHRSVLRSAFPDDGRSIREWLRAPAAPVRALSFWANSNVATANGCAQAVCAVSCVAPARESLRPAA